MRTTSTIKTHTFVLSVLAYAVFPAALYAVPIAEWGIPTFDNTIVGSTNQFSSTPPTTYNGALDAVGDNGAYYVGVNVASKTPVFAAATSANGSYQIQDNSNFDRIRIVNTTNNTDHETMVAWQASNWLVGLGSDSLESLSMGGFESGTGNTYSFIIQTNTGWYSTAAQAWSGSQVFTIADVSAVSWFSFSTTMNTDGNDNIGVAATPVFSDVISVGFYFHSNNNGTSTSGFQAGYFQATIDGPGAATSAAPVFTADPIVKAAASMGDAYVGQSLSGSATDANAGDTLTYSKVSGPDWLNIAADGTLSGTPDRLGTPSAWTVSVSDGNGGSDTAELQITVTATYPYFEKDELYKTAGVVGASYVNAITGSATDDTDTHLTFAKVTMDSAPGGAADWLTVGSNGKLTGTPATAGSYTWTVSTTANDTNSDTTVLRIDVTATAGPAKPTNVIVIISDDAGYADFSFMDGLAGNGTNGPAVSIVPTPHLDELATRGVTMSRAYVAANCQPTRAAIVTGAYQQRIGNEVVGNNLYLPTEAGYENVYEGVPTAIDTVWDRFKTLGYRTGAIGKWHLGSMPDSPGTYGYGNRPERQGIDYFVGMWHGSRFFDMGAFNNPTGSQQVSMIRKVEVTDHTQASLSYTDIIVENTGDPEYPNHTTDPVNGYTTTVFGKESAKFVSNNYNDPNGFFLYVAHPAPHKPWEKNSPDYDDPRIAGMPETVTGGGPNYRKIVASMTISMDKEIGRLMDRLEDPNGDGNPSDSVLNNTLVIFLNDNGGVAGAQTDGINGTDNGWLDGFKGSAKEGGIRVPMIVAGAGVDPSVADTVYHKPVHGVDIMATSLAVTGNPLPTNEPNIDGVNILPHINANTVSHDLLVHRWRGSFTVIKGDYNLVNTGNNGQTNQYRLYKVADGDAIDDISEVTDLFGIPAHDAKVAERFRDLTDHEVRFDKSQYPILNRTLAEEPINIIDHFEFRPGSGPDFSSNTWYENNTINQYSLLTSDGCPETILEFPAHSSNYTANNDNVRQTGQTFIANQILLTGAGSTATATIQGNDLLLANNLSGDAPEIALDATNANFVYAIDLDVIMYNDLKITGDGTATLNINGVIAEYEPDFYDPRDLIKDGTSTAVSTGLNTYTGDTVINAGTLSFTQINAANESSAVRIASTGATLNLNFTGTDTIDQLFIGGVQQPAGVYGSSLAQITGTGTLTVRANYSNWAVTNAPGQSADQDYDLDGVRNGIEYFMGETGDSHTALPVPNTNGTITWPMGATYDGDYGTDFIVQTSIDLQPGNWTDVLEANVSINTGTSISYTGSAGGGKLFVRLLVNAN